MSDPLDAAALAADALDRQLGRALLVADCNYWRAVEREALLGVQDEAVDRELRRCLSPEEYRTWRAHRKQLAGWRSEL